jgi:DNA-binding transcriptional ArsR family regulator
VVWALAHAARRQILLTLHFRGGEATAGEIAARFEHKWSTTTRHLRVLEEAGLLRQERRGRTRVYAVDRTRLVLVSEWLGWFKEPKAAQAPRQARHAGMPATRGGRGATLSKATVDARRRKWR